MRVLEGRTVISPCEPVRHDGQTWEEYAKSLEHRIAQQRAEILSLTTLRNNTGDKAARRQIEQLRIALAKMTVRWENDRAAKFALIEKLRTP